MSPGSVCFVGTTEKLGNWKMKEHFETDGYWKRIKDETTRKHATEQWAYSIKLENKRTLRNRYCKRMKQLKK